MLEIHPCGWKYPVLPSTSFSGIKRLMKAGYVIRVEDYEIEDPFFREWILRFCV